MTKIILTAHGALAPEMKKSAEMIFGSLDKMSSVPFLVAEGLDSLTSKIKAEVDKTDEDCLIVCDLFAGTPFNASCTIAMQSNKTVEVLAGMSLPMVLELVSMVETLSVEELVVVGENAGNAATKRFDNPKKQSTTDSDMAEDEL